MSCSITPHQGNRTVHVQLKAKLKKEDFIETYHLWVPINKLWIIINVLSIWIFITSSWIPTTSSVPRPRRSTPTPPYTVPMVTVFPTTWFRSFLLLITTSSTSLPAPWPVAGRWAPAIIFPVFERVFTSDTGRLLLELVPYCFEVIVIWRFDGVGRRDGARVSVSVGSAYKVVVKRGFISRCSGGRRVRWRWGRGEAETLLEFGSALSLPGELVVVRWCFFFFHFQIEWPFLQ